LAYVLSHASWITAYQITNTTFLFPVAESIDELSEVESIPLSKSEERLNFLSRMNSQEAINPSTSRSSIYNQKLLGLFSTADDTSTTTNRRCVQFMKKSNMPKQNEK
ncbi:unnamed protein product, partial [Trichobilharzia szidati]